MTGVSGDEMTLRLRVDRAFENWAGGVYRRAWWVILACVLVLGALISYAPNNSIDVDLESMIGADDPAIANYQDFTRQFGRDDVTLMLFEPADPFDLEFLTWLRDLHHAVEDELPYLDEVTSLINARVTRGEADRLIVEDLFEDWPPTPERLAFAKEYATTSPFYQNLLLSRDHRMTVMVVELADTDTANDDALEGFEDASDSAPLRLGGLHRNEAMRALTAIVDQRPHPDFEVMMVGEPIASQRSGDEVIRGSALFTLLGLLGISGILVLLFRRVAGAVIPLTLALLGIGATFGVAGIRGLPLNINAQTIPNLLLAVSVSSSLHLIFIFFQLFDAGDTREGALRRAFGHSALPVVFATLTTAGGLASFLAGGLVPLRDVGIFAPIGIVIGLVLSLTLLPAILSVMPVKRRVRRAHSGPGRIEAALVATADLAARRPVATLCACFAVAAVTIAGCSRLYLTFYPVTFIPEDDGVPAWTQRFNDEFAGASAYELVIDTGRENGLHDPALLKKLDQIYTRLPELRGGRDGAVYVGKAISFVDVLKEIHQALNENRPEFYTVPDQRQLIAQELLLFENSGSDDLEELVDSSFRRARFTLRVPFVGGENYPEFVADSLQLFREELPADVKVHGTGALDLFVRVVELMGVGTIKSYGVALVVITLLMMFLIGSLRGGLASMIPNLLPIAMAIGLVGWVLQEFGIYTISVAGIAIGLAVDDTIHVFHQFHRYFRELGDPRAAVRETMRTTGLAILTTTTVLAACFIVYAASPLQNLRWMGWTLTTAIVLAFVADVLVAPALLSLLYRKAKPSRA